MTKQDRIGHRGENLFTVMITKPCDNKTWFFEVMLGEKYPTIDYHVDLLDPTREKAYCFVQVKSTDRGYSGGGANRKLNVKVSKKDVHRLRNIPAPTYLVGIEVTKPFGEGYIMAIDKTITTAINGMPTKHRLNCRSIKNLWKEVDDYWKARDMLMAKSAFTV